MGGVAISCVKVLHAFCERGRCAVGRALQLHALLDLIDHALSMQAEKIYVWGPHMFPKDKDGMANFQIFLTKLPKLFREVYDAPMVDSKGKMTYAPKDQQEMVLFPLAILQLFLARPIGCPTSAQDRRGSRHADRSEFTCTIDRAYRAVDALRNMINKPS